LEIHKSIKNSFCFQIKFLPEEQKDIIKSRRKKWVGHEAFTGGMGNAYTLLVIKPEGKRSLGRLRHRWKDNI
jgi:hypothetical protein